MDREERSVEREAEQETEQEENPYVAKFVAFLESAYKKEIERLVQEYPEKRSINIDFKDLEEFDYELADELLDNPDNLLEAAELAAQLIEVPALDIEKFAPHLRFFNLPQDRQPLVRDVGSQYVNKLICVEGAIRQITDAMPKITVATWQCRRCGNTYNTPQDTHELKTPPFCECRHRDFTLVQEHSEFIDYQKVEIQEPLEKIKGNEQAAAVEIFLSDDLVHQVNAGQTVKFTGILRLRQPKGKETVFGRYIEAIHVNETDKEFDEFDILPEEAEEIKALAKDPKIYEKLTASIAPSIFGHDAVKESIILQMFGGVKKILPGDHSIRGNIHILLMGDPGTGKSQLLTATDKLAPKSIYTAGRTTSGIGLTAAAVKDDFGEGGWTLKAGALVLSSGGMCMADELDKMSPDDRVALHEAMEQGMVSVAKAGIVTRFKADTTILAAANPKHNRFDPYTPFSEQINMPPSLISRFDLFFMIKDVLDRTKDEQISKHILESHHAGEIIVQNRKKGKKISAEQQQLIDERVKPAIDADLLKRYISYARQNTFPVMIKDSIKAIGDFYMELRDIGRKEGSYAATHRQLEGLVRISEASAKVRLSDTVELEDAERAIRLVKTCLEETVTDPETGKIDYDIIASGQTHTQMTNLKKVLDIVKGIMREGELDAAPIEQVIEEVGAAGIEKDKVHDLIEKLVKKGDLYRPRHKFLKPVQRE